MTDESSTPKWTVGRLLSDLQPGQLWTLIAAAFSAAAAITGGAFAVGQRFPIAPHSSSAAEGAPIPCHLATGWPRGEWYTWGHIETDWTPRQAGEKFPQISPTVTFDSNRTYWTQTDQLTKDARKNAFTAEFSLPLSPDGTFTFVGHDSTGFHAEGRATVTKDGCMIHGSFGDSKGNRGSLHLLYKHEAYFIRSK